MTQGVTEVTRAHAAQSNVIIYTNEGDPKLEGGNISGTAGTQT